MHQHLCAALLALLTWCLLSGGQGVSAASRPRVPPGQKFITLIGRKHCSSSGFFGGRFCTQVDTTALYEFGAVPRSTWMMKAIKGKPANLVGRPITLQLMGRIQADTNCPSRSRLTATKNCRNNNIFMGAGWEWVLEPAPPVAGQPKNHGQFFIRAHGRGKCTAKYLGAIAPLRPSPACGNPMLGLYPKTENISTLIVWNILPARVRKKPIPKPPPRPSPRPPSPRLPKPRPLPSPKPPPRPRPPSPRQPPRNIDPGVGVPGAPPRSPPPKPSSPPPRPPSPSPPPPKTALIQFQLDNSIGSTCGLNLNAGLLLNGLLSAHATIFKTSADGPSTISDITLGLSSTIGLLRSSYTVNVALMTVDLRDDPLAVLHAQAFVISNFSGGHRKLTLTPHALDPDTKYALVVREGGFLNLNFRLFPCTSNSIAPKATGGIIHVATKKLTVVTNLLGIILSSSWSHVTSNFPAIHIVGKVG